MNFLENFNQYAAQTIKVVGIGANAINTLDAIQGILSKEIESWVIANNLTALQQSTVKNKINIEDAQTDQLALQQMRTIEHEIQLRQLFDEETKLLFIIVDVIDDRMRQIAQQLSALAKEQHILNIGMSILPSVHTCLDQRKEVSHKLRTLIGTSDGLMVLDPDIFAEENPSFSSNMIHSQMNYILASTIHLIEELIGKRSIVDLGFDELEEVIQNAIFIKYAAGIGDGEQRAFIALENALSKIDMQYVHSEQINTVLLKLVVKNINAFRIADLDFMTDYLKDKFGQTIEIKFGIDENPAFFEEDILKVHLILTQKEYVSSKTNNNSIRF